MKKWFWLFVLMPLLANAAVEQRPKVWLEANVQGTILKQYPWHYQFATQLRGGDNDSKFEQFYLIPSVFYEFNQHLSLWLGYSYIPTVPNNQSSSVVEQRVWQQLLYSLPLDSTNSLAFRTRLETRWRQKALDTSYRLRQRVELMRRFGNRWHARFDIFDELFISMNNTDWTAPQTVNQNRVFIGFVIPVNTFTRVDVGYINIFRPRSQQDRIDHVFSLVFSFNLDRYQRS